MVENRKLQILLVEPSSVFSKLLIKSLNHLEEGAFEIAQTASMSETLDIIGSRTFDAILLNLNLPDCAPDIVFGKIRKLVPETATIITTSSSDKLDAADAVKKGAQDYLFKPDITPTLLRKTILYAIERQKLQIVALEREKLLLTKLQLLNQNGRKQKWSHSLHSSIEQLLQTHTSGDSWEKSVEVIRKLLLRDGIEMELDTKPRTINLTFPENEPQLPVLETIEPLPQNALVAEDSIINQKITKRILKKFGIDPVFVEDGTDALEACKREDFALIFMDIHMPKMDGIEATREIRLLASNTAPRIIALTASDLQQYEEVYLEAGMDGCLHKPIQQDEMERVLSRFFELKSP